VVADVKNAALDRPAGTELYFHSHRAPRSLSWELEAQGDPMGLVSSIRNEIRGPGSGRWPISSIDDGGFDGDGAVAAHVS